MKETVREEEPSRVQEAKQDGEIWRRWPWVEPSVWTERMLNALETGVKGGKWFSLIDKVYMEANLLAAWRKVRRNRGSEGVDRQSVEAFARQEAEQISKLSAELREGRYQPKEIRRVYIPKLGSGKLRPLGIPTVKDRIVQTALRHVLEPIFEQKFAPNNFGFRPRRGCKDALRRVQQLLDSGYHWVVDVDIERYFDTIPHRPLMAEVEQEVADGRVLSLVESFLRQRVLEGTQSFAAPERGTPQGAVISPLLANIYLHPVDVEMMREGFEMVRYADDCVVLCRTEAEAERAMRRLGDLLEERQLTLHPEKTRIVNVNEPGGFDFLGYHFERGKRWPRTSSVKKLRDRIRPLTRRANGYSLSYIIDQINPILRGWFEYFKHSHPNTFGNMDRWVRGRLRSILRKRSGRKGRALGDDHRRWTNHFFQELGLFTMTTARQLSIQSR